MAAEDSGGPPNALTAFLRAQMRDRYPKIADLAKASGVHHTTLTRLYKDESPHLATMPRQQTLEGLARAFPEVGLAAIRDIALRAVGQKPADAPLTLADLARARTRDLHTELARRAEAVAAENKRREHAAGELCALWTIVSQLARSGLDERPLRGLDRLPDDIADLAEEYWTGESAGEDQLFERLRERLREGTEEERAAYSEFNGILPQLIGFSLDAEARAQRYQDMRTQSGEIEDDPLPDSLFQRELEELRDRFGFGREVHDGEPYITFDEARILEAIKTYRLPTKLPPLRKTELGVQGDYALAARTRPAGYDPAEDDEDEPTPGADK